MKHDDECRESGLRQRIGTKGAFCQRILLNGDRTENLKSDWPYYNQIHTLHYPNLENEPFIPVQDKFTIGVKVHRKEVRVASESREVILISILKRRKPNFLLVSGSHHRYAEAIGQSLLGGTNITHKRSPQFRHMPIANHVKPENADAHL